MLNKAQRGPRQAKLDITGTSLGPLGCPQNPPPTGTYVQATPEVRQSSTMTSADYHRSLARQGCWKIYLIQVVGRLQKGDSDSLYDTTLSKNFNFGRTGASYLSNTM